MAEGSSLCAGLETSGYRIERCLGAGGMGEVWEATQLSLDRRVALKVIAGDIAADPGFEQRFRREAQMAARVDHDAVLPVYDHGALDDGRLFLAMKLIDGPDLAAVLAERGRLALDEAVSLLLPIAEALDAAHEQDLVHRDVKPSNVLLERHGDGWRPYLADFGLARPRSAAAVHTRTGNVVGTIAFMAPEQARGDPTLDGRADVYGFGCMLYRTVTGEDPYPRDTDTATMLAHANDPPPVPSRVVAGLPRAVDRVVQRAMEKDIDRRAPSVGKLMHWLAREIEVPAQRRPGRRPWLASPTALAVAGAYSCLWLAGYLLARPL